MNRFYNVLNVLLVYSGENRVQIKSAVQLLFKVVSNIELSLTSFVLSNRNDHRPVLSLCDVNKTCCRKRSK